MNSLNKLVFCKKCCMDGTASDIVLDEKGICNFCHQAQKSLREIKYEKHKLPEIIKQIKSLNGKYDVLCGMSGGVDSSTVLDWAVKNGLKPLCFSVSNGWDDPKAYENVMRLVEGLKVPFYRYTIDLKKFRKLQVAFLKAGQINVEIPTDHILLATTYEMANKYGIKWILSGGNVATESVMPASWGYQPRDLTHIKSVYKWAWGERLKGLPTCGLLRWNWYKWIKGIKIVYPLDYINYNREKSIKMLEEKYGYKSYGDKHCENVFTSWYMNYYLYEKFGIDKRKAHLSSLINSGQMTRKEAMELLQKNPEYPKLGVEGMVLSYQKRPYTDFATDEKLYNFICKLVRFLKHGNFKT